MIATNHIERERTPVPQMLYGVYLYYASRSLRLASKILEPIIQRSHVSIWKWVQRFASASERFSVERRDVRGSSWTRRSSESGAGSTGSG